MTKRNHTSMMNEISTQVNLYTLYDTVYDVKKPEMKGFAQVALSHDVEKKPMTWVLVLDHSGSMGSGRRMTNVVNGLKALHSILDEEHDEMVVIPFNHEVKVEVGPTKLPMDLTELCEKHLVAWGGTNIELALEKALGHAERCLEAERPVTVILMTDGEDPPLMRKLRDGCLSERMQRGTSGLGVYIVGICVDADAMLLGRLAEAMNGTYTIVPHNDIAGLLGSNVGAVMEYVEEKVVVEVWGETEEKERRLITSKAVRLNKDGTSVKIPFVWKHEEKTWTLSAMVKVLPIGTWEMPQETSSATELRVVASTELGVPNVECVVQELERLCLDSTTKLTDALGKENFDDAQRLNEEALCKLAELKLDFGTVIADPVVGERMETTNVTLVGRGRDIEEARGNYNARRELSHRMCSEASTARNSGLSFGIGGGESNTQQRMRTMSTNFAE